MKVAVIIDTWFPFVGGGQVNALEISKQLAKKNVQIEIITRNNGIDSTKYPKNLSITKLDPKSPASSTISKIIFILRAFFYVYKNKYDLIHAHAFMPGITAWMLWITKKTPTVFTVHGSSLGTKLNSPLSRLIENVILTKIPYSAQITVSRDFLKIKNINKKMIFVSNGVDSVFLKPLTLRKEKQLLCVARLHPQKNLRNLISAFKLLEKDFPDYSLVIAGDGALKVVLQKQIRKLKLSNKVKLVGNIDKKKLKRLYYSSRLFVLPSIYEGQPIALLEAIACNLPVIATSTGDIPFLFRNVKNSYIIKNPLSPHDIAITIKKALEKKELNLNTKPGEFIWKKAAEETLKVYESI